MDHLVSEDGYYPIAWDLGKVLSATYSLKDEKVGCLETMAAKARAAEKLDIETRALTRVLDCEATFAEFAEALARCADVAISVPGDEARTLAEKLDAFLGGEYLDA